MKKNNISNFININTENNYIYFTKINYLLKNKTNICKRYLNINNTYNLKYFKKSLSYKFIYFKKLNLFFYKSTFISRYGKYSFLIYNIYIKNKFNLKDIQQCINRDILNNFFFINYKLKIYFLFKKNIYFNLISKETKFSGKNKNTNIYNICQLNYLNKNLIKEIHYKKINIIHYKKIYKYFLYNISKKLFFYFYKKINKSIVYKKKESKSIFFDFESYHSNIKKIEYLWTFLLIKNGKYKFYNYLSKSYFQENKMIENFLNKMNKLITKNNFLNAYHYGKYELIILNKLILKYNLKNNIEKLKEKINFIDLYNILKNNILTHKKKNSIKDFEVFLYIKRNKSIKNGLTSIIFYKKFLVYKKKYYLNKIVEYNKQDCKSILILKKFISMN